VFEDIRAAEQGGANVSGVKAALAMLGNDCGAARPPAAWPLNDDQQATLKHFMIKNGLIS
jgi:4-hydroxy-tetrahydrodipicolinate synthase